MGERTMTSEVTALLRPGDRAPNVVLPAVNQDGTISFEDYWSRGWLLLGLFRGVFCPFCRRQLVQLAGMLPRFSDLQVTTVVVVNSPLDRARLYFTRRPTPLVLAADPERVSHRAFGGPLHLRTLHGLTSDEVDALLYGPEAVLVDPTGELGRPTPFVAARHELNRRDGYVLTADEEQVRAAGPGLQMLFLIDRGGVIRWRWIETAEQPRAFGRLFPLSGLLAEVGTTVACADVSR